MPEKKLIFVDNARNRLSSLRQRVSKKALIILACIMLIIAIPLSVVMVQTQQEIRSNAAGKKKAAKKPAKRLAQRNKKKANNKKKNNGKKKKNNKKNNKKKNKKKKGKGGKGKNHKKKKNNNKKDKNKGGKSCKKKQGDKKQTCKCKKKKNSGKTECTTVDPTDPPSDDPGNSGGSPGGSSSEPTDEPTDEPSGEPTDEPTESPTPTEDPNATEHNFAMTLFLDGIGRAGDPEARGTEGNMDPLLIDREVFLDLYDADNNVAAELTGLASYDTGSGSYKSSLTGSVAPGSYSAFIDLYNYPSEQVPGIVNVAATGDVTVRPLYFKAGDVNDDGSINLLDYALLAACYQNSSEDPATGDCQDPESADLNSDGIVDLFDLNLFIREISNYTPQTLNDPATNGAIVAPADGSGSGSGSASGSESGSGSGSGSGSEE